MREAAISLASAPNCKGVVITCSALKRKYREFLSLETPDKDRPFWFFFLKVSREELVKRAQARQGHYMKAEMVDSQLHDLEYPNKTEPHTRVFDAMRSAEETERSVIKVCMQILAGDITP